ncbi:TetR/AcrR family transcriptional regulator [Pseudaestuariivita sp.]|uniref:TetR/AcrR family transcriptional regulator n=1 Tax=Pseudaestuariivita sp. TaxID=2211669 RepID=UPI00405935C7
MTKDAPVEARPKRQRRRKEARPAEIVAAGISEFEEHGFHGANLTRIARKAGISKGTIYLYFPSKEALFLAAIEEHITSVMGETEAGMMRVEGTTRDLLTGLLKNMYARFVHGEAQALFRILLTESDRMPEVIGAYHAMTIKRGSIILKKILMRGVDRGEVLPGPVLETPQVIIAPAVYFAVHTIMFKHAQPLDFEKFFDAHVDVIFHGVLVDGRPGGGA